MPEKVEHTVAGWNGQSRPATLHSAPQASASTASPVQSMNFFALMNFSPSMLLMIAPLTVRPSTSASITRVK